MAQVISAPVASPSSRRPISLASPAASPAVMQRLTPLLVLAAAGLLAVVAYVRFLEAPRQLWTSGIHDRNAHYYYALCLAADAQRGDVLQVLHDLDGARVWGPLHPIVTGVVLLIGGPRCELAVLPSLAAWAASALLAFLIARRAVSQGGNLAGLAAATFVLASPAYHAFAVDIMLEGPGACLTLLVLYCYLVAVQDTSAQAARWLGVALTSLFLLKYNYWLLVAIPLGVALVAARPGDWLQSLSEGFAGIARRDWLLAQLRHPLNYLLAATLGLAVFVALQGGGNLHVGGQHVSIRSADNLVHAA